MHEGTDALLDDGFDRCGLEVPLCGASKFAVEHASLVWVEAWLCEVERLEEDGLLHRGGEDGLALVDPPPRQSVLNALAAAAPQAMLHLFYCRDEVQFTGKVLEHEFDLRAPLAKVYRQLGTGKAHPLDATTERLLLTGGKYLRQPTLVARCLKILEELSLIEVEEREGKPILILPETGKKDLEMSPTYRAVKIFYEECSIFLSKSLSANLI